MDMKYEYLIRKVYQTGRTNQNGADAAIYRRMENAYTNLSTKSLYANQSDREYEFRKQFTTVRSYVNEALSVGIEKIKYSASKEEISAVQNMRKKLDFSFYDKEELDFIISEASAIFRKNGLDL